MTEVNIPTPEELAARVASWSPAKRLLVATLLGAFQALQAVQERRRVAIPDDVRRLQQEDAEQDALIRAATTRKAAIAAALVGVHRADDECHSREVQLEREHRRLTAEIRALDEEATR